MVEMYLFLLFFNNLCKPIDEDVDHFQNFHKKPALRNE